MVEKKDKNNGSRLVMSFPTKVSKGSKWVTKDYKNAWVGFLG